MDGEDFTAWAEYYRKARICPHCGNDDKVAESEHPFGGVWVRRYVCLKCGWNWEVEAYREENEGAEAAEEKIAGRPQILKGDIIRVEISDNCTPCCIVWAVQENYVYGDSGAHFFPIDSVVAVYRFDGKGFGCIWQDEEAMARYAKEAEGKASE